MECQSYCIVFENAFMDVDVLIKIWAVMHFLNRKVILQLGLWCFNL